MKKQVEAKPISKGKYKFVVSFTDEILKKRVRKYFEYKKDAENFADSMNTKIARLGFEAKNISYDDNLALIEAKKISRQYGKTFLEIVRMYDEQMKILSPFDCDTEKAVAHYVKWNDTRKQSTTLSRAVGLYLDALEAERKSQTYINTQKHRLERFTADFSPSCIVAMISPEKIEKWIKNLKTMAYKAVAKDRHERIETNIEATPETKNNYRRTLSALFNFCFRKDFIQRNPIEKVSAITKGKKEPEIYKVDEVRYMMNSSPEKSEIRAFLAIGAFGGLRVAEIQRLTWDRVHLQEKEIVLDASITKTSQRRIVKMTDNLVEWLTPYISEMLQGGLVIKNKNIFRKELEKFREANKINWIDNGLRHSGASYYLALTKNANETAEQMGHSVAVLKNNYMGLVRAEDAVKYFQIKPTDSDKALKFNGKTLTQNETRSA